MGDVPQQESFNNNPTTTDDPSTAIANNALGALAYNLVATTSRASTNDTEELMGPHISADAIVEAMNVVDEDAIRHNRHFQDTEQQQRHDREQQRDQQQQEEKVATSPEATIASA